uniref:Brachyury n=1 Tax=Sycon raphanus TaxID=56443 RepID=Q5Y9D3_9METZ|nr:brachyury [Sycon raphanus]
MASDGNSQFPPGEQLMQRSGPASPQPAIGCEGDGAGGPDRATSPSVSQPDGTVPYPVYLREAHQAASEGDPLVSIQLEQQDLWEEFKTCPTEMVITRQGRRMFPIVTVSVKGLRPEAMYSVFMDLILVDNHRWRYVRGKWVSSGKADKPHGTIYRHPDSPHYGSHWMKSPISFNRVKLTNRMGEGGHLVLNSLHKYEARVHVVPEQGQRIDRLPCNWKSLPETQFIAVTAYQNEDLTRLKILRNPYAKAFSDKKTRVSVSEEHFSGGLQFIQPHMPFSDALGEDVDGGEASEQEDCPCVSPITNQGLMASFEQDLPQGSTSAPGTLTRDEEMDVEPERQTRSLPVDSAPQNLPSAYYIRDKSGQITLCGQVVRPEDIHLHTTGLVHIPQDRVHMPQDRDQAQDVQHVQQLQPPSLHQPQQQQQHHDGVGSPPQQPAHHMQQPYAHRHPSPQPQMIHHYGGQPQSVQSKQQPMDTMQQQSVPTSPPASRGLPTLQSPPPQPGHITMLSPSQFQYSANMPSSPPSQTHPGISYQQLPQHLSPTHTGVLESQLAAATAYHSSPGNQVSPPPSMSYMPHYPVSQGGGAFPVMAAGGGAAAAMHPLLQAQYAAAGAALPNGPAAITHSVPI